MAYSDILPVKKVQCIYIECDESEATHWMIGVGFGGGEGVLIFPFRDAAEVCMKHFVLPFEEGKI